MNSTSKSINSNPILQESFSLLPSGIAHDLAKVGISDPLKVSRTIGCALSTMIREADRLNATKTGLNRILHIGKDGIKWADFESHVWTWDEVFNSSYEQEGKWGAVTVVTDRGEYVFPMYDDDIELCRMNQLINDWVGYTAISSDLKEHLEYVSAI